MEYLTTGQVALLLGYSDETIRRWFDAGNLPGDRLLPETHRRIPKKEFEEWAQERNITLDWSKIESDR